MLRKKIASIVLAEDWTPGKQLASVLLLFLALAPFVALYMFRSSLIALVKSVLT